MASEPGEGLRKPNCALTGYLSDRVGRRRLLAVRGVLTAICSIPPLSIAAHGVPGATVAKSALAILVPGYLGATPRRLRAEFPCRCPVRASRSAYDVAVALFGGTVPLTATLLVEVTGCNAAPGAYLALTALISLAPLPVMGTRDEGAP